jgi:hypothetical protein
MSHGIVTWKTADFQFTVTPIFWELANNGRARKLRGGDLQKNNVTCDVVINDLHEICGEL